MIIPIIIIWSLLYSTVAQKNPMMAHINHNIFLSFIINVPILIIMLYIFRIISLILYPNQYDILETGKHGKKRQK